jgi:large subunit ribosomal protein L7e
LQEKRNQAGGNNYLVPEVFVSNYMKQQRNFVHYKRFKTSNTPRDSKQEVIDKQQVALPKSQQLPLDSLVMAVRVKESRNSTPQAQKILKELGLKEINNVSFVRGDAATMEKLLLVQNYIAYGTPTKKILDDVIRKRGYLRVDAEGAKDGKGTAKRVPISDNVLVEKLLGEKGCICVEDLIDAFWRCKSNPDLYQAVRAVIWPIQLAPLKEDSEQANTKHDATGRTISKKTTRVVKGGYLGMMGPKINEFVEQLI